MSVNRRFVLKGVSLSGIATLAMDSSAQALASALMPRGPIEKPMLTLVNDSAAAPLFLQGVITANGVESPVQRVGHDMEFILQLEHHLRNERPLRVIG